MGAYQVFGNLQVNLPGKTNAGAITAATWTSATAQAHVSYEAGGVQFQREFLLQPSRRRAGGPVQRRPTASLHRHHGIERFAPATACQLTAGPG